MTAGSAHTVCGVDIGGTKTRIVIADGENGTVLVDRTLPSTGWQTRSIPDAAEWLAGRIHRAAGDTGQWLSRIAVGAHACETPEQCERLSLALGRLLAVPVTVVNDAELLVPAAGFRHGIGVVAGTGSIVVGRHRETDAFLSAGGWGWVLGDEGSASALVREAAKAVLGAADEGAAPDPLEKALLVSFGRPGLDELAAAMSWDGGVETWGSHAPAVFAAADEGSPLAAAVIDQGGRALSALVGLLAARGARTDTVVVAGGVISGRRRLLSAFEKALAERLPGTVPVLLEGPPVNGALALALREGR